MNKLRSRIRLFYGPFLLPIALVMGIIALEEAAGLAAPWIQGRLIEGLFAHTDLRAVALLATLVIALWIVLPCVGHLRWRFIYQKISQPLNRHIMRLTMERLGQLSLAQHLSRHSGVKQNTIWEGQKAIESLMRTLVFEIVPMLLEIAGVVALLIFGHYLLAGIVVTGGILFALRAHTMNRTISGPLKDLKAMRLHEGKLRGDIMRNMELVLLTAQESRAVQETCESYERVLKSDADIWLRYYNLRAMVRDQLIVATRGAALVAGIWLVWTKQADVGQAVTWWVWTATVANRISSVGWLWRDIMDDLAAATVYLELLEVESDTPDIPGAVHPERFRGRIEVRDAWLSYAERPKELSTETSDTEATEPQNGICRESLRGVTLTIEPGQRVAIVGPSGAGKSTLVYALMRGQFLDRGSIHVDGHDLNKLAIRNWRSHVGIVPQQVFLFDRSLKYNLSWPLNGKTETVTREQLDHVVDMACLRERVDGLEHGYDTEIGERGIRVSGGERQRIGIARAIIAEPDVLIFDEATSNLDAINERAIHEAIRTAGRGRTTIIIAHRLSTVRDADCIFVMKDGAVVGQGRHEELMGNCPTYRELVEHQSSF